MPSTLIAAAVSAFSWLTGETVLAFVARTVLFTGISRLIAKREASQSGSTPASGRTQNAPVANNTLPVVYGTAFIPPTITDAKISTDQKFMWYVCTIAEVADTTITSAYTFGDIYYDGKLVTFDGSNSSKVVKLTTNGITPQEDTSIDGKLYIWKFPNGSNSGISTGGANAITLLSDSTTGGGIPANERWNGPIYSYTAGPITYSPTMTNTAFLVVRVEYNEDASLTGLGQMNVEITNSLTKPGSVLNDYLLNTRYGCAIPSSKIDVASLAALDAYSDELITYIPTGGGTATQPRYRINGPVDPANDCLTNLQQLVDACDSWLQYSELTGTWGVVINQSYTDYTTLNDLFLVDSSNLVGGVNVNPIDLNSIYNEMEVQYPDFNVQDQYNFPVVKLQDYYPQWMSPNEPVNRINLQYPQVNNYIQAKYLGVRRLVQGRLDLTVNFTLDYSGIQLVAGDVIKITLAEYGWVEQLFRVNNVQEQKNQDGNLFAVITAFQYDDDVYNDDPLTDFVLDGNTGLSDPNIIDKPTTPIITNGAVANGAINYYVVSSNVPASGTTLYMDFNIGNSSNVQTHKSYSSVQVGDGTPYTANTTVTINVADSSAGTYYWSATARNQQAGRQSNSSAGFVWGGPSVSTYNGNVGGITGNNVAANSLYLSNFNPNLLIPELIKSYKYEVSNLFANVVVPPVNVTSIGTLATGNWVTPKYLSNVYSGSDSSTLFPYYQNTSSQLNGYRANSTSSLNPAQASQLILANGDYDWWVLEYASTGSSNIVSSNQILHINGKVQLVSNANTTIQTVAFVTASYPPEFVGAGIAKTDTSLTTIDLIANEPRYIQYEYDIIGSTDINGGGIFIRQFDSANVIATGGSFTLSKTMK